MNVVKKLLKMCIVLYKICIANGDAMSPQLDLTVDPASHQKRDRNSVRELLQMTNGSNIKKTSTKANAIRDDIMEYLWNERKSVP